MALLQNVTKEKTEKEERRLNGKAIGRKLIELRGDKSRNEVAKELGISISALSMYELGERIPRDEIKIRIANFYNKTVMEIFFEKECHGA